MKFHFKKSRFSVKSQFKKWNGADGAHSLNRDFTVLHWGAQCVANNNNWYLLLLKQKLKVMLWITKKSTFSYLHLFIFSIFGWVTLSQMERSVPKIIPPIKIKSGKMRFSKPRVSAFSSKSAAASFINPLAKPYFRLSFCKSPDCSIFSR